MSELRVLGLQKSFGYQRKRTPLLYFRTNRIACPAQHIRQLKRQIAEPRRDNARIAKGTPRRPRDR